MNIVEKIKQTVESAGYRFEYQSDYELNRIVDTITPPTTLLYLQKNGGIEQAGSMLVERLNIELLFCDLCNFDFGGLEVEEIIDQCKVRALNYIKQTLNSGVIRVNSIGESLRVYNNFDVNLCGFLIRLNISELKQEVTC